MTSSLSPHLSQRSPLTHQETQLLITHKSTRCIATGLTVGAVLLTSACGGSSTSGSVPTTGAGTASSAVTDTAALLASVKKDPTLANDVPALIKSTGVLTVGSNVQSPPNNFYGADGKTPIGFEVDIITAIGKKLGLTVSYQDMGFNALITSLQSGRVNTTIAGMNDTKARQGKIQFVDYFNSGITIMVQKGNPNNISSSGDLCGKSIAVVTGTSQEDFAKLQSAKCTSGGKSPLTVTATDSDSQNQTQLRTGRVMAILNDLPSAVYISRTAGNGKYFQTVDQAPINGGPYGIGVIKSNTQLAQDVQKALQSLMSDGTYGKILSNWKITSGALKTATINAG